MSEQLMSAENLEKVTGFVRYSKQSEWFKNEFGFDVVRCGDGSLIITWATFQALQDRRAGLMPSEPAIDKRPPVYLLRKA